MDNSLFLDLPNGAQRELLLNFKRMLNINWVGMAKILGVNKSLIFFYCNDTSKMPFKHLQKLCSIANLDITRFYSLNMKRMLPCAEKIIALPNKSEELAEFLGILAGDGCIVNGNYATYVTCDAELDFEYIQCIVSPMFERLFGVSPFTRVQNGAIHCWVNSKQLFNFLSKECAFPVGEKKGRLSIPSWISSNKSCSVAFLRGLFDTDGGIHRHHKKSAQLDFTSHSRGFLVEVYNLLKKLDFNPRLGKEDVWIFEKKKIYRFFRVIGSKNPKYLFKYTQFMATGEVPLTRDLIAGVGI